MQNFSFEEVINLLQTRIPDKLISSDSFKKIKSTASVLPSALIQYTFGFERELGNNLPEADFLVSLNSSLNRRDSLDDIFRNENYSDDEVWCSIKHILEKWQDKKNFIYHRLDNLWLEFDIRRGNFFTPGFFFAPMIYENSKYNRSEQYLEIFKRVFACFNMQPTESVIRLTKIIPDDSHIFQVGLLPARSKELQRFCLSDVSSDFVEVLLPALSYNADVIEVKKVLKWLQEISDRVEIDLDLGNKSGSKIGFECYMKKGEAEKLNWENFLSVISNKGISLKEEVESILKYPGISPAVVKDEIPYPTRLLFEMNNNYFFKMAIHHVKIVYEQGRHLTAKVYLSVNLMKRKNNVS